MKGWNWGTVRFGGELGRSWMGGSGIGAHLWRCSETILALLQMMRAGKSEAEREEPAVLPFCAEAFCFWPWLSRKDQ